MTELERYQQWCEQAPLDEAGRAALAAMQNDETERKGCFGAELQFGTAGIRGIMGIGTNRLNDFTVRRTAQGLAAWLTSTELPQRCAIGYDSRHNSRRYAELCAVALAERGVHVYVYHELARRRCSRLPCASLAAAAASSFPPATMRASTTASSATARTAAR